MIKLIFKIWILFNVLNVVGLLDDVMMHMVKLGAHAMDEGIVDLTTLNAAIYGKR